MAVNRVIRYVLRAASPDAERAMFDFTSYVRAELPACHWSMFRAAEAPATYLALVRSTTAEEDERLLASAGARAFDAQIAPWLAAPPEHTVCELVTSTDLAPRRRGPTRRPR